MTDQRLAVIIMAAGKGTRMKNPDMAKVMYPINGKPMIDYVVALASRLNSSTTVTIVGWQKDSVIEYLRHLAGPPVCVVQSPQLGTGHAVMQAEKVLQHFDGDLLILSGDVPLLSHATVRELIDVHRASRADATVLTAEMEDASGYGRVLRGQDGEVIGVVEHKDATGEQLRIREINSGIYVFKSSKLFDGLNHITPTNSQKEYYLTDILAYFWRHHWLIRAVVAGDPLEIQGINTLEQLEYARVAMRGRVGSSTGGG